MSEVKMINEDKLDKLYIFGIRDWARQPATITTLLTEF